MGGSMPMKNKRSEAGYSLVEILVACGLLGILVVFSQNFVRFNLNFEQHIADRYDLMTVSQDLQRRVDCKKLPKTCTQGKTLTLFDKKDASIVVDAARSSKIKRWTMAAECGPQNDVLVRVAMQNPSGEFIRDPVSKKILNWEHDLSVLMPAGTLCAKGGEVDETNSNPNVSIIAGPACVVTRKSQLPCNPVQPPPCAVGSNSTGQTLDTFGGSGDNKASTSSFGQRWLRYCMKGD